MANNVSDFKLASTAAGFTLGFGTICVWNAIKQTKVIRSPLRSVYIFMVWGEIAANLMIGILAWLFLDGTLKPGVPVFFSILFLWVFEVQLLMQIIINRINIVVDDRKLIRKLKWGTAFVITTINIAVFIVWIPAHLVPPPIPVFVTINRYWDRTSKVLILLVDAGLNYFFLRTVKLRLVNYHGLTKYAPLVRFNARLMVLSVSMDLMLICLMSLKNQVVYIQFHPVAYMVKLNIEISMASLITKIAKSSIHNNFHEFVMNPNTSSNHETHSHSRTMSNNNGIEMKNSVSVVSRRNREVQGMEGIAISETVEVSVEHVGDGWRESTSEEEFDGPTAMAGVDSKGNGSEDEMVLAPPVPVKTKMNLGWKK